MITSPGPCLGSRLRDIGIAEWWKHLDSSRIEEDELYEGEWYVVINPLSPIDVYRRHLDPMHL